jgi:hypothetical protein
MHGMMLLVKTAISPMEQAFQGLDRDLYSGNFLIFSIYSGGPPSTSHKDQVTHSRYSGSGLTKAHSTLNAHRAARRVTGASPPGNEAIDSDSWIPACAGMTVVLA